ncbi:NAD-dependent epimerase/dehydratase family protein [Pseudomonadales bacterium]|nr:NAD-dependent epimerase/dehydratase family protein [Pseudomonadales bacterium]
MNILVTGGAGFIGSHLCENLLARGDEVFVIDDLSTGGLHNLASILDKITLFQCRVEDFDFDQLTNMTAVVHLAAQASVPLSISNFYESSKTNILSSLKIIDYCARRKIPMVYASSSAIYGGLSFGDDEVECSDLLSPYAADKFALELYAKVSSVSSKLSSIGLRFFNVYGPRQDPSNPYSGVISIFIKKLLLNEDITINGGMQTRDFVYVADIASVIARAIDVSLSEQKCDYVNVLTERSVSVDWLADTLIELTGSSSTKIYNERSIGDPLESNGSGSKLSRILEFDSTSFIKLEQGLVLTLSDIEREI